MKNNFGLTFERPLRTGFTVTRSCCGSQMFLPCKFTGELQENIPKSNFKEVAVALRTKRLRCYGHVPCASSWTKSITSIATLALEVMGD